MNTGETLIINHFFADNYAVLVQKCKDYSHVYNYNELQPDELISELYIYTLESAQRTSKLHELIELSAATLSKMYNYSSKAFYYISRILYNVTHGQRSFSDSCNRPQKILTFEQDMEKYDIPEEDYEDAFDYNDASVIYTKALELSTGDNWWKYKIWLDYYKDKMTYKELSLKYKLTITPLFYAVRDYNNLIKESLGLS